MYFVYILKSIKNSQLYTGRTDNLHKRLAEHKSGKNRTTNRINPTKLIFFESFSDKRDAIRRERYFKTSKGKSTLKMMLKYSVR